MAMDAATLKDRPIVSVSEAMRLGKVDEVLFVTDPLRVAALRASGDDSDFIVPIDRINRFGPDAVMVETPDVRELAHGTDPNVRTLADLRRLKVVDEEGNDLGTVRTVEFNPDDGQVEQLITGDGGPLGIGGRRATIKARAIRGVGPELVTVASAGLNEQPEG
jgi:sporulation protein YlmC with PRC-barrel domain